MQATLTYDRRSSQVHMSVPRDASEKGDSPRSLGNPTHLKCTSSTTIGTILYEYYNNITMVSIEYSPNGRASCQKCRGKIASGAVRVVSKGAPAR